MATLALRWAAVFLMAPCCALAQERSLYWDALTVQARLDADGALRVVERHAMVFTGAWNGGERRFNLRRGQALQFDGVWSELPGSELQPLVRGNLDRIGEFRRMDGAVVRWRSRMPDDPPFSATPLTYELRYVISGVLVREGDSYRIDHDLAFPDRAGVIRSFDATLQFDPVWVPLAPITTDLHRDNLQPGESVLLNARLRYTGGGNPSAISTAVALPGRDSVPWLRFLLCAILLGYFAIRWRALLLRDRRNGRFDPLPSPDIIDEAWLRQHVFSRLPEEVGAAWDRSTSASEVAALIARLELEGKLKTSLEAGRGARQELRMELLCDRGQLVPHERALIDALFFDGTRFTSAAAIRKHYSKSGFDPAALIRRALELRVPSVYAKRVTLPPAVRWVTAVLLFSGLALSFLGGVRAPETLGVAMVCLVGMLPLYGIALLLALRYRNRVHDLGAPLGWALAAAATPATALGIVLVGGAPLFPLQMAGLALVAAALTSSLFNAMRSRDTPEALALRRTLAFARRYFERELAAASPRLKDEWFPYLLAFGLGPHVDRWFRAQGGRDASAAAGTIAHPAPHSGSGGGWSGGGGAFGGGGATGSWVAAVGGVSAGVSAASSGSSGGSSSSSGGSSGGGGGGGW